MPSGFCQGKGGTQGPLAVAGKREGRNTREETGLALPLEVPLLARPAPPGSLDPARAAARTELLGHIPVELELCPRRHRVPRPWEWTAPAGFPRIPIEVAN